MHDFHPVISAAMIHKALAKIMREDIALHVSGEN
jgi:hypothetical protein